MQAQVKYDHPNNVEVTPEADLNPGTILKLPDGRAAVVPGDNKIPAGETGVVDASVRVYKVPTASATTFAEGAEVGWDESAELALASSSGSSDYSIGKAWKECVDGETEVLVALNMHRSDARDANGRVVVPGAIFTGPTSNPAVAGVVYSNSGVLTVSAG